MRKVTKIEVLTGPQGSGKSTVMRQEAIDHPGRYLFASPTIDLIKEQVDDFERAARLANAKLEIHTVYSQPRQGSTAKRLTELREQIEAEGTAHCVVLTTHATLMGHPLHGFNDWHARIDEAPAAVQAGQFTALSLGPWLKDTFDLDGGPAHEWSAVAIKTNTPNWKDVERDTGAHKLVEFIKQAKQPNRVFVKARSWDDNERFDWFSMWTPLSLSHFASVQIAGSSYTDSVGFKAAQNLFSDVLGVTTRRIEPKRKRQPSISIRFFTQGHKGTTSYWETHEGLRLLAPVEDYLVANLSPSAFWSGNKVIEMVMYGRMKSNFIPPLAAGLNKHREADECAFIFSATATNDDLPLMAVFGLTKADIQRAREEDAIAQFVMRGAIRNLDYGGPYSIYLYSKSQAERLKEHLVGIGFTHVELVGLAEVGIMDAKRPKPERVEPTEEDKAAKAQERLDKDKARKKAKREGRPPGRPLGKRDTLPRRRRTT